MFCFPFWPIRSIVAQQGCTTVVVWSFCSHGHRCIRRERGWARAEGNWLDRRWEGTSGWGSETSHQWNLGANPKGTQLETNGRRAEAQIEGSEVFQWKTWEDGVVHQWWNPKLACGSQWCQGGCDHFVLRCEGAAHIVGWFGESFQGSWDSRSFFVPFRMDVPWKWDDWWAQGGEFEVLGCLEALLSCWCKGGHPGLRVGGRWDWHEGLQGIGKGERDQLGSFHRSYRQHLCWRQLDHGDWRGGRQNHLLHREDWCLHWDFDETHDFDFQKERLVIFDRSKMYYDCNPKGVASIWTNDTSQTVLSTFVNLKPFKTALGWKRTALFESVWLLIFGDTRTVIEGICCGLLMFDVTTSFSLVSVCFASHFGL